MCDPLRRRAAHRSAGRHRIFCPILIVWLLLALSLPGRADWQETELAEELGTDALADYAEEAGLDQYGTVTDFRVKDALTDLLKKALEAAVSPDALAITTECVLIVLLCSLLRSVFSVTGVKADVMTFTGAAAIAMLTMQGNHALTALSQETLIRAQDTANVLLPVLSGAALLSGSVTAAAAKYAAAAFFLNVLLNLCVNIVIPVVKLYAAAAAAEAAADSDLLTGVLSFLKWYVTMSLTVLVMAFTMYLSLCGLLRGTADAAVLRGAKTTISTTLPLVGSIASDAAAAILSAAAAVRQSVGVFGLTALAGVLLAPFLRVGLQYLLFKGAAAASAGLADSRLRKLLTRLSESMGMLLAAIGACGLMLYFSIYALMEVTLH